MEQKNIMSYETVLPENFDGTFRFTNYTDEDFTGKWGSKEYRFPAHTTSPLIILNQTPLEIQQIRKKFAKDLAEREFFKSEQYLNSLRQERNSDGMPRANSIHGGVAYSLDQLTPFIQRCLVPLEVGKAVVTDAPKEPLENRLSKNDEGELNTQAIDKKVSLKQKAQQA